MTMKADKKEINAIVLDVLQKGHPDDPRPVFKREPVIQAIGIEQFKLLELVPKKIEIQIHDKVYIGDGERDKIERVKRRISYDELTQTAKLELPFVIEQLVKEHEKEYVDFFNKSISISPKLHMLHLLPGIGKKSDVGNSRGTGEETVREFCRYQYADQIDPAPREDDHQPDHGRTPGS